MCAQRRVAISLLSGVVTIFILALPLVAQVDQAALSGAVSDASGAMVPGARTISNWLNPAAFALPAKGTWGNLGRFIARGPRSFEIDSSLTKTFKLSERFGLDFRAAAFNLLNHPTYKNPSSSLGSFTGSSPKPSASFGRITDILNTGATGTGAPRRIEFMLRLEF